MRLGENNLNKIKNCSVNLEPDCFLPVQDFEVQYHIHHGSYDKTLQINDIGLTRLLKEVVYQGLRKKNSKVKIISIHLYLIYY